MGELGVSSDVRFRFGKNWSHFLKCIDKNRVRDAQASLKRMLGCDSMEGKTFVDIGSGSGIFSLAARSLGASVYSFDYDVDSVRCTEELKRMYLSGDHGWIIQPGSILDDEYVSSLGQFDVVYSWGVLHHTGAMWKALKNATTLLKPGGLLYISIYNDQGLLTRYWEIVKSMYNRNAVCRFLIILLHSPYLLGVRSLSRAMRGEMGYERGMSLWYDMLDWLGGYPFETAAPGEVVDYCRGFGLSPVKVITCGRRHGCNEYVFNSDQGSRAL